MFVLEHDAGGVIFDTAKDAVSAMIAIDQYRERPVYGTHVSQSERDRIVCIIESGKRYEDGTYALFECD